MKTVFVRETIARTMRLSYHARIKYVVPEELTTFVPPEPVPKYRLESISQEVTLEILDSMKNKQNKNFKKNLPFSGLG